MPNDLPLYSPALAKHLRQPPPEILYHYTGQDGLLGIIQSQSLWATDIYYLNDSTEFSGPLEMLREALKKSNVTGRGRNLFNLADLSFRYQKMLTSISVACFCEFDDLLSQWRGYATQGYGYSLKIHTPTLKKIIDDTGFLLGKCIYNSNLKKKIIDEAVQYILGLLSSEDHAVAKLYSVLAYVSFFKDHSFKEEAEWRLVSVKYWHLAKTQFRRGKSMIIPYTRIDIGKGEDSPIHGVRVGPCPHMDLSIASVRKLSSSNSLNIDVYPSSIPFRDW